jgi:CO/xanthine dehydrogenase FAD-binding subunit
MRPFAYERPTAVRDVVQLLGAHGPAARLLAGGTDLIIRLRDGSIQPDVVVDVKHVTDLGDAITVEGNRLVIGARAVMTDIGAHPVVRRDFAALADAAMVVGSAQIRNRATLAGNLCNASPAADTAPALLVFGAVVVAVGPAGERRIPLDDFFVRSGVTTLGPGELVAAIELPLPAAPRGSAHVRRTRRRGHDLASVTLAAVVDADGGARIAYGSVGPRPILAAAVDGLVDPGLAADARERLLDELFAAAAPSPRSLRASPDYRLAMLRVLARRGVDAARARLEGAGA